MMHSRHAFIRTPNDRFSSSSMKTPRSGRKIIKSKGKSWDSTNSDLNRYKLSPEEIMRRKQVRSTPVNSGPIVRSSIKKAKKQPEQIKYSLSKNMNTSDSLVFPDCTL